VHAKFELTVSICFGDSWVPGASKSGRQCPRLGFMLGTVEFLG